MDRNLWGELYRAVMTTVYDRPGRGATHGHRGGAPRRRGGRAVLRGARRPPQVHLLGLRPGPLGAVGRPTGPAAQPADDEPAAAVRPGRPAPRRPPPAVPGRPAGRLGEVPRRVPAAGRELLP